jgi:AraC-like DNA-binding protein
LFRRFSGQTPYQYLLRRKLEAAAARLSEPGALVKEVALEAGFSDPFHFSRVFKRVFGVAPSVFRAWRAGVGRVGDG